jgi:hypothetical protein
MGQKFAPKIWAEMLNFRPPEIPSLNPEIPPQGPEFLPLRLAYIKEGAGVKIPLGIFFPPDPLSPNHRCHLFKDFSGDSLATGISDLVGPHSSWCGGSFPPRGFRHG